MKNYFFLIIYINKWNKLFKIANQIKIEQNCKLFNNFGTTTNEYQYDIYQRYQHASSFTQQKVVRKNNIQYETDWLILQQKYN